MISQEFSKGKLKFLQSLKLKKYRQKYQTFLVEGRKVILEIMNRKPQIINALYAESSWIEAHYNILQKIDIQVLVVTAEELGKISSLKVADQVCAELTMLVPDRSVLESPGWILFLDGIADPGNLGSIIRTADWFGASAVCLGEGCVDVYNPKSLQASKGSFAHVPVFSFAASELLALTGDKNWYMAELNGEAIQSIISPPDGGVLVIGSESHGISPDISAIPHTNVTIPRREGGLAESLNAAIAAAIMLNHLTS